MSTKEHFYKASWILIDQAIISLGNFLVNIFIARQLAPGDYGTFALLIGGLFGLQIVNSSLIFYPMSVRMAVAHGDDAQAVLGAGLRIFVLFLGPLCALLALTLFVFNLSSIVPAALAYLSLWQLQEAMRRGLLARFRIKAAIIGDAVSYLGQFGIILGLAAAGSLSLPNAFYGMAATSGLAVMIQARQLQLSFRDPIHLRLTLMDFWSIGSWSLANNLISYLRFYVLIGILGFGWGAAAAAAFQAVLNVLNFVNPVVLGLCNIIPQTAALARAGGGRRAWSSTRPYILLGIPPIFLYYAAAFTASEFFLHVFYGSMSTYVELSLPLRILAIAFAVSYGADMICSFLHGIDAPRLALVINAIGLGTALVLVFPLTNMFGLAGSGAALALANAARLIASRYIIAQTTADDSSSNLERITLLPQRSNGPLDIRHLIIDPCEGPLQANGLSIVARGLSYEQMVAGHTVTLFYLLKTPREELNSITDVPIRCLPMTGIKVGGHFVRLDAQVIEALTAGAADNTIFHIHHGRDPLLVSLTSEFRRRRIPYAMTFHGRYSHIFDQNNHVVRALPALYLRFIERRVLEAACFVQAVAPAEQDIVRRIAPRAVCELIFNAPYSSRVDGIPQESRRTSLSSRFPLFGFCGRYAIEHKGLDLLLEGFAEYRRAGGKGTLELVGTGPAREELAAMADSLSVGGCCKIGGPLFGEDKKRVLQTWDFFVMTSRFEGQPTGGLEAALLGLPLVASKSTGLTDRIAGSLSGFVIEALSPQAVAKALFLAERVSADEWTQMSKAAFNMAMSTGDRTVIAARLVDLYRRPRAIEVLRRRSDIAASS